jgi:hypothetical protein
MQSNNILLKIDILCHKLSTLRKLCHKYMTKEQNLEADSFEKILKIIKKQIKVQLSSIKDHKTGDL